MNTHYIYNNLTHRMSQEIVDASQVAGDSLYKGFGSKIKSFYKEHISPLEVGSRSIQFGATVVFITKHAVSLPFKTAVTPLGVAVAGILTVGYVLGKAYSYKKDTDFKKRVSDYCDFLPNRVPAIFTRSILNAFITPMRLVSCSVGLVTNPYFNEQYNAGNAGPFFSKLAIMMVLKSQIFKDSLQEKMVNDGLRSIHRCNNPRILKSMVIDPSKLKKDRKIDFFGVAKTKSISSQSNWWPMVRVSNYVLSSEFWRKSKTYITCEVQVNNFMSYQESKRNFKLKNR